MGMNKQILVRHEYKYVERKWYDDAFEKLLLSRLTAIRELLREVGNLGHVFHAKDLVHKLLHFFVFHLALCCCADIAFGSNFIIEKLSNLPPRLFYLK